MYVTFICPGMPFSGDFLQKRKSLGGSETACYYVAKGMAARGHKVLVMTNDQSADGKHDWVDYSWIGPQSDRHPCGEYAHTVMETMPNDLLVLQRAAGVHRAPHASKLAFWWLHDLALVRSMPAVRHDAHLYDGILAVSEWHKKQITDTWDIRGDGVFVMPNSIDGLMYQTIRETERPPRRDGEIRLLYQSRYERGIDVLIAPGGIMDQLAVKRPEVRLLVCGYDNQPDHMRAYYAGVDKRIGEMRNVSIVGHLSKPELAALQMQCDLMVYPGDFEETSCISAMEAQAAGLPFVGADRGALRETCQVVEGQIGGSILLSGGVEDRTKSMVELLSNITRQEIDERRTYQLEIGSRRDWSTSAEILETLALNTLAKKQRNTFSMVRSMIDRSDIIAARKYMTARATTTFGDPGADNGGYLHCARELAEAYTFTNDMEGHYDSDEAVADIARNESLDVRQMLRFREAEQQLMQDNPSNVLDYGCQKGHYIWSLAQKRPDVHYTGVDVSPRVIKWAQEHCVVPGARLTFRSDDVLGVWQPKSYGKFDALLLGEVLEHVEKPATLMLSLSQVLTDGARVVITTPFGDWEGKNYYSDPKAPRYHLHHFDRADLVDMFGHNEGFLCTCVPAGRSDRETLGSYVVTFVYRESVDVTREIDWTRKFELYAPRETLSFVALARNSESTILRSLMTVREVADEFIIALDKTSTDRTRSILEAFRDQHAGYRRFEIIDAESPIDIGFDAARNRTVEAARCDWILWLDNDEDLIYPERLHKYLRHNQFDGYAVAQHHMSADPVGILSTDWPVRVFRKNEYLRFVGVVHEHPDDIETMNSGPRMPAQLPDLQIIHHGYTTEPIRRARFARNFPLIRRDRKQNPDRLLGRLLWLRDLAHMCMFELERTQGRLTPEALGFANEGLAEWEELLTHRKEPIVSRMIRDGVEYYTTLVAVTGQGFEFDVQMHGSKGAPAELAKGPRRKGRFLNREHLDKYLECCVDEQTAKFDSKYF